MELAFAALHQMCAPLLDELDVLPTESNPSLRAPAQVSLPICTLGGAIG